MEGVGVLLGDKESFLLLLLFLVLFPEDRKEKIVNIFQFRTKAEIEMVGGGVGITRPNLP